MLDRLLGKYMVDKGILTRDQLRQVYHVHENNRAKLGVIAVSEKLMSIAQAEQVNSLQATIDKRFGDLAVERGYLTAPQVSRLLELQKNSYLAFVQAIIDLGYFTMERMVTIESDFRKDQGLTETDLNDLKEGDIEKIVPSFIDMDNPIVKKMFAMGVKNLYRLVDNHVYIGKAYVVNSLRDEVVGYQKFHGDENATVAIFGKTDDVQKMAIAYTKEEFIETEEDALDAVCELINCMNGLYASDRSRDNIRIELEPPVFRTMFSEERGAELVVLPVYISGGMIKYCIAASKDVDFS